MNGDGSGLFPLVGSATGSYLVSKLAVITNYVSYIFICICVR